MLGLVCSAGKQLRVRRVFRVNPIMTSSLGPAFSKVFPSMDELSIWIYDSSVYVKYSKSANITGT